MKSYAVWCKQKDKNSNVHLEIHANLWRFPDKKVFLDLGLSIKEFANVEYVKVFYPFTFRTNSIIDLGGKFRTHPTLIKAVFNDNFSMVHQPEDQPKQLVVENERKKFIIYTLDIDNGDCELEHRYDGTLIKLKVSESLHNLGHKYADYSVYYRIRVILNENDIKNMFKVFVPKNSLLESSYNKTEIIDFRLNDKRICDESMLEEIKREGDFQLTKIHFFLLTNSENEIVMFGNKPTCRRLEEHLWKDYVDEETDLDNILAYHWKQSADVGESIQSYNLLIKASTRHTKISHIVMYILVLLFLSVFFNLTTEFVKQFVKWLG